jgi:hypothetical protein
LVTPRPDATWDNWTWKNVPCSPCTTIVRQLDVPDVLAIAAITVKCVGRGCPASRTVTRHGHAVDFTGLFKGHALLPGDTVQLRITAPGTVGRVVTYTIRAGESPSEAVRCVPPGARKPMLCAGETA